MKPVEEQNVCVDIPILNMVDLTVQNVLKETPFVQTVGLLASEEVLDVEVPVYDSAQMLAEGIARIVKGDFF